MKRAEFITKWIEALTSGEYKQTKGALEIREDAGSSYCCLGVACVVATKNHVRNIDIGEHQNVLGSEQLPDTLARFLGIDSSGHFDIPIRYRGKSYDSLIDLNDEGVTFKVIARIILEQFQAGNFRKP